MAVTVRATVDARQLREAEVEEVVRAKAVSAQARAVRARERAASEGDARRRRECAACVGGDGGRVKRGWRVVEGGARRVGAGARGRRDDEDDEDDDE